MYFNNFIISFNRPGTCIYNWFYSLLGIWNNFFFYNKIFIQNWKKRLSNNELRYLSIIEAFGAAKEIKIGGLEKNYIDKFSNPAETYARTTASARILGRLPHFFFEAIAFGGVMLIILYLMTQKGSFNNALPILSLYIFAGVRLMPAIKQIYASFVSFTFVEPSLNRLYQDIKNLNSKYFPKIYEINDQKRRYIQEYIPHELQKKICPENYKKQLSELNSELKDKGYYVDDIQLYVN